MKRSGNLFEKIVDLENLQVADAIARKGKKNQYGIQVHDRNRDINILALRESLLNKTYHTSPYTTFKVYEPKEREVFRLPYYPDRITHHAIMNVLEEIFVRSFTADTYSCIKGRGIHLAIRNLKRTLNDHAGTTYCLKLDIKKFYPSVDHDILKSLLRRKFKDQDLLWLLDEIIDSAPGLPIGNYLSQYFANFYLTYFDHWLKEVKKVKNYFRYADDLVILSCDKQYLHSLLTDIKSYLDEHLKLQVKGNHQVFPVAARGIDFLGYVVFHTHIRLRKNIKQNMARKFKKNPNRQCVASYMGWVKHCNGKHLVKKLLYEKVQGHGYYPKPKRIRWRQARNQSNTQSGDCSS
jgi:retron-type reverse transcriptase